MPTDNTQEPTTVGKTCFYQGENNTHPLFRIEPGIPCQDAREQASELMGYVRDLIITGLMDGDHKLIWPRTTSARWPRRYWMMLNWG